MGKTKTKDIRLRNGEGHSRAPKPLRRAHSLLPGIRSKHGFPWASFRSLSHHARLPLILAVQAANAVIVSLALRAANDIITRATPLKIMLMPTSVPIAQTELKGHCM